MDNFISMDFAQREFSKGDWSCALVASIGSSEAVCICQASEWAFMAKSATSVFLRPYKAWGSLKKPSGPQHRFRGCECGQNPQTVDFFYPQGFWEQNPHG